MLRTALCPGKDCVVLYCAQDREFAEDLLSTFEARSGQHGIATERLAELRHEYGLDQPLGRQFVQYEQQVASGDLGTSLVGQALCGELLPLREQAREVREGLHWTVAGPAGTLTEVASADLAGDFPPVKRSTR